MVTNQFLEILPIRPFAKNGHEINSGTTGSAETPMRGSSTTADYDEYYQVLIRAQKDYHGTHFDELCHDELGRLLELYDPKQKSAQEHPSIISGLPTEILDLILQHCDPIDAACLSLTKYSSPIFVCGIEPD
jgi:hypothetical protein